MIAAMVLSDVGCLLPHTCQFTMQGCEENAKEIFPAWDKMKELGAKVVQVQIEGIDEEGCKNIIGLAPPDGANREVVIELSPQNPLTVEVTRAIMLQEIDELLMSNGVWIGGRLDSIKDLIEKAKAGEAHGDG